MFRFDRQIFYDRFNQTFGAPGSSVESGLTALLNQIEADDANWANIYWIAYGLATFKWETGHTFQPVTVRYAIACVVRTRQSFAANHLLDRKASSR